VIDAIQPTQLVGVGTYAEKCLARVKDQHSIDASLSRILHPSPASPAANRDWAGTVNSNTANSDTVTDVCVGSPFQATRAAFLCKIQRLARDWR
jgi:hypothetical protein